MPQIALGLQAPEKGPNAGILERMARQQGLANGFAGRRSIRPKEVEDGLLQRGQGSM